MYGIINISDKENINYGCLVHDVTNIRPSNDGLLAIIEWEGDVCDDHIKPYLIDSKEWTLEDIKEEVKKDNWKHEDVI